MPAVARVVPNRVVTAGAVRMWLAEKRLEKVRRVELVQAMTRLVISNIPIITHR